MLNPQAEAQGAGTSQRTHGASPLVAPSGSRNALQRAGTKARLPEESDTHVQPCSSQLSVLWHVARCPAEPTGEQWLLFPPLSQTRSTQQQMGTRHEKPASSL